MNDNKMMIQGTEIRVKEWHGKRVVTFKDIDAVHQRPEGTARKRFNDNRKRFVSGVDFFKISPSEFRTSIDDMDSRQQNDITLITESGYLMLVKSFTDDLAWKVQRELVDIYFRIKEAPSIEEQQESSIDTDKLIKCAEIMGSCLEGNRKYVILILKNIFPGLTSYMEDSPVQENKEDVSVKVPIKKAHICTAGYAEPFNHIQLDNFMYENNISNEELGRRVGCSDGLVGRWRSGHTRPSKHYRVLICEVLGVPQGYFDNSRRMRRTQR